MSITLLQGIVPVEFKTIGASDILVTGAHVDAFNGVYSLSPSPTSNGPNWIVNGLNNYLHTTNSGYRFFCSSAGYWVLASNVPSPVDANWNYHSNADAYYEMLGSNFEFPPPDQSSATFSSQVGIHTEVIPHSTGRVEVIRSLNLNFNGVYDQEGTYNGKPYYRRGDSSYGIIYTDWFANDRSNPAPGAWQQLAWAIVDDLPPQPLPPIYYYVASGLPAQQTNGWHYIDWGSIIALPTDVPEYTDSTGNGNQLHLNIVEL